MEKRKTQTKPIFTCFLLRGPRNPEIPLLEKLIAKSVEKSTEGRNDGIDREREMEKANSSAR